MDKKSLETVFSIAILCQSGDKWQPKTLFKMIYDLHLSIVLTFLIVAIQVQKSHVLAHMFPLGNKKTTSTLPLPSVCEIKCILHIDGMFFFSSC